MASSQKTREWRKTTSDQEYLISTDQTHLSHDFINNAFGTDDMYWAKPKPVAILRTMLSSSVVLGLYTAQPFAPPPKSAEEPSSPETPSPTLEDPSFYFSNEFQGSGAASEKLDQVGFVRLITDHVTIFYLTDVYVAPEHRGKGLGKWLIGCCREMVDSKPHLVRMMLMADAGKGKEFYEKHLGAYDIREESAVTDGRLVPMTKRPTQ